MEEIINKVAQSGIITIDLEEFYDEAPRVLFDIKPLLFQELILKEKDFRAYIKTHEWGIYKDKYSPYLLCRCYSTHMGIYVVNLKLTTLCKEDCFWKLRNTGNRFVSGKNKYV